MRKLLLTISIAYMAIAIFAQNQDKKYKVGCVAFYNLENLFDTIDTPNVRDFEFTAKGKNRWTPERYQEKLTNMSFVIKQLGGDFLPIPPAILGVCEIENRSVLEDLVKTDNLKEYDYKIVHHDGIDRRGIDCGLLYLPQFFEVTNSNSHRLVTEDTAFRTRDQLMVSGIFDGEPMHIIVNHWPSRSGGEARSRPKRNAAAQLTRQIVDSILATDSGAKIIVMGDLNDDPTNESVLKYLKAKGKPEKMEETDMFNPYYDFYKKGIGSLAYRDSWNNFDQIIVSNSLLGDDKSTYKYYKAKIFNKKFMTNPEGKYKGYPFRTFAGGTYQGGYSDHFPVYILLIKEDN